MPSALWWIAVLALGIAMRPCAGEELSPIGTPNRAEPDEGIRASVFKKMYGKWPPHKSYPGGDLESDTDGWKRRMDEREEMIRNHKDHSAKWELWLDLAQMRFIKNFTSTGWSTAKLDPGVHSEVVQRWKAFGDQASDEGAMSGGLAPLYIDGQRDLWNYGEHLPGDLWNRMLNSIRGEISSWTGLPNKEIEFTMAYGARVYRNGSVLREHVDVLETHVLSAVYCIAIEGEEKDQEPWYLGAHPDLLGQDARVDLRPGQLFLYESAKVPHGRRGTFRGDKYAAIFVHFRPRSWNLRRFDRVYWLPPGWSNTKRLEL